MFYRTLEFLVTLIRVYFGLVFGVLSFNSINFHLFGDLTITGEGLQILTYARHSWLLSSESFFSVSHLLCHGESVYNGHRRGPVTRTPITERLAVELPIIFFCDLGLSRLIFEHLIFCFRGQRSNRLHHRRGCSSWMLLGVHFTFIFSSN